MNPFFEFDSISFVPDEREIKKVKKNPLEYARDKCLEKLKELIMTEDYFRIVYLCKPVKNKKGEYTAVFGNTVMMCIYLKQYTLLSEIRLNESDMKGLLEQPLKILQDGHGGIELAFDYLLLADEEMPKELKKQLLGFIEKNKLPKKRTWDTLNQPGTSSSASGKGRSELLIRNIEALLPLYDDSTELLMRVNISSLAQCENDFFELYNYLAEKLKEDEYTDFFAKQIYENRLFQSGKMSRKMYTFLLKRLDLIYSSVWYQEIMLNIYGCLYGFFSEKDLSTYEKALWGALCSRPDGFLKNVERIGSDCIYMMGERTGFLTDAATVTEWYLHCVKKCPELDLNNPAAKHFAEYIFLGNSNGEEQGDLWFNFAPDIGGFVTVNNVEHYFIKRIHFTGFEKFVEEHIEEVFARENVDFLIEIFGQYKFDEDVLVRILDILNKHHFYRSIPFVINQLYDAKNEAACIKVEAGV